MAENRSPVIGTILLAAGSGSRFGGGKLLADLNGKPLVLHALDAILAAGLPSPLAVVADDQVEALLQGKGVKTISLAGKAPAIGRSVAAGIQSAPAEWDAVLICLGDMPAIRPETLRALAAVAGSDRIVRPVQGGQPGNPLIWGSIYFSELSGLTEDEGAKSLVRNHRDALVEIAVDDPGIHRDIDTVDDLESARAWAGKSTS